MSQSHSRRDFMKSAATAALTLTAAGAAAAQAPDARAPQASRRARTPGAAARRGPAMSVEAVEAELRQRARQEAARTRLPVHYYRIRSRLSYPLPVAGLDDPALNVTTIPKYPWATWLTWTLENRINALGWAAQLLSDDDAAKACAADLAALAAWPAYTAYYLSAGHAGRMLWRGSTWTWPDAATKQTVADGARRHVEELLPQLRKNYGEVMTTEQILARTEPSEALLHNIPLIGTIGTALAARVSGHEATDELDRRIAGIYGAILAKREQGHTEAISYDGYILDFLADWLSVAPDPIRRPILDHPRLRDILDESYMLAAPGSAEVHAPFADNEDRNMPFHLSGLAKLEAIESDPTRAWHLSRVRPDWMTSSGLGAVHPIAADLAARGKVPEAGAQNAHYALVLRSGYAPTDRAVAISCTNSPMNHLPPDNGTIVIGSHGQWIVTDPAYQQYQEGEERVFTIGATAHNAPVLGGKATTKKEPNRLALESNGDTLHAAIDLTACYPPEANAQKVIRHTWLDGDLVVVADEIQSGAPTVAWHWHGNTEAAWWVEGGAALIHLGQDPLWVQSPGVELKGEMVQRLPGTTGPLSLVVERQEIPPVAWWIFNFGEKATEATPTADGKTLTVAGKSFSV